MLPKLVLIYLLTKPLAAGAILFLCDKLDHPLYYCFLNYIVIIGVPDMGAGRCLGPEGNGVSLGEGGEGGPGPPERKEDKQSALREGGGNIEKEEEGRTSRT
jgi:hypothetical protein